MRYLTLIIYWKQVLWIYTCQREVNQNIWSLSFRIQSTASRLRSSSTAWAVARRRGQTALGITSWFTSWEGMIIKINNPKYRSFTGAGRSTTVWTASPGPARTWWSGTASGEASTGRPSPSGGSLASARRAKRSDKITWNRFQWAIQKWNQQ